MTSKQLDELVNMFFEFVALNKTPDYRFNSASADAVKAKKKQSISNITSINIGINDNVIYYHSRSTLTNSAPVCNYELSLPKMLNGRRLSLPNFQKSSLLKKFQRHSHLEVPADRQNSDTISEFDQLVAGNLHLKTKRQHNKHTSSSLLSDIAKYCNGMSAIHIKI